jgi:hypothetical protein
MKFSESIVSNVAPSGLSSDHGEPYGGGRRAGGQQRRQPFRRRRSWRPRGIQCGLGETKAGYKKHRNDKVVKQCDEALSLSFCRQR